MTNQDRVDWTISYLRRHANDVKRPGVGTYQPSLYDALDKDDALEVATEGGDAIEQP